MDGRGERFPSPLPVFPLTGALLLPHARLPLHIFEPRYVALIEDALAAGRVFGMIQPGRARPASDAGPALSRVGCLGRIQAFSETEDGRFFITLQGLIRFAVLGEAEGRRGYRRVFADYAPFAADLAPPLPRREGVDRTRLIGLARTLFARHRLALDEQAVAGLGDDLLVATLAQTLPLTPPEKQALLEAPDVPARAAALTALLEMAAAGDEGGGCPS
jgi:Lon protease-like protein